MITEKASSWGTSGNSLHLFRNMNANNRIEHISKILIDFREFRYDRIISLSVSVLSRVLLCAQVSLKLLSSGNLTSFFQVLNLNEVKKYSLAIYTKYLLVKLCAFWNFLQDNLGLE